MHCRIKLMFLIFLLIPVKAYPLDFCQALEKGPLIAINRDNNNQFRSITTYALIYAPLRYVWDTILNIEDYSSYMPRVTKSKTIQTNEDDTEIIAEFEIKAFMRNTKYQLKYIIDNTKRTINVYHHSGDLEGSHWHWRFQSKGSNTFIICTGASLNFSSFLRAIDDRNQTLTVGVNISSMLTNIRYIKERCESIYENDKNVSNGFLPATLGGP